MFQVTKTVKTLKVMSLACLVALGGHAIADDKVGAVSAQDAKQAIAVRKATFSLIANNFKGIGETLQGKVEYNQADILKRAQRVAFLSEFLDGTFPAESNLGEPATKTKASAFKEKEKFDQLIKEFQEKTAELAKVAAVETTASDAFKKAAGAVAQTCKGCHDAYKHK